ncbi:uncharacterized protein NFIA_069320 [Aspergillus fischeri NRRL 181]|uniref:Uncharacterized protein n=1 Tax=Neosartorya fischeri (strain ATCC 1020 / DSM 3700 / CBS 544.65 / FGSC A1164 / JCM 1740 / NRRL 181 / WB 181) TaxID=331117 RepID=A1D7R7_NEOFI|nr:conserved hypothetical protein [Aspergillus fischeri NRRL 181]EAW21761.1 conserved hypothetical protein [Aspergillus fischeri NRRL 181]KAG2024715.1 hypothetical protein GB937_003413 [Aspergillus fischeri]
MKSQSITAFMKGLKIIFAQMETVPYRPCQKRVLKQAATPPPTIDLDLGDDELFPCECTLQGINSLDVAYLSNPLLSSLKTKECGLNYNRRALDALEPMSACTRCSGKDYHLVRTYEGKDQQPLLLDDYQLATVDERAALLCMFTYVEIKRFHDCVGSIIEALREQAMFDEDSWAVIKGQAYKLAIDTAGLRFKSIHC